MANSRLVDVRDDAVTFRTKDGKTATLAPVEFLRRFVQHVLPEGFHKIRHYGLYTGAADAARRHALECLNPSTPVSVEARFTASTVEVFYKSRRVASHVRSFVRGGYTTNPEHMPKIHRDHAEWTPTRMLRWAETVGPKTAELVAAIIEEKPHPEHGYRACLGILRLGRRYGEPRLEAASARAVIVRSRTVLSVESILKRGLDRQGPVDATVIGRDAGVARRVSRRPQIPGSRRAAGGRADAHQGLEGRPDQVAAMAAPTYTIDATWMAQVVQTAQWAMDAGLYAFVNTHHEADGNGGWVTFPADPTPVVAEVTAVWTQIATAFLAFDSHLMLECFNEPNEGGGGATTQAMTDLNQYLVACVNAIRGTGGANATRVIMIQGIGASPSQTGINSVLNISVIDDPNLIFSVHTYYPTNFGLSTTPYAWGSASDYTSMSSSVTQLLSWLPGWGVVIGEWGSESAQATANRVLHAHVYSRDTAAAGMCSMWWDNGGSYAIFNRTTGAETYPTIVNALVTGAQAGLASPGTYATLASP